MADSTKGNRFFENMFIALFFLKKIYDQMICVYNPMAKLTAKVTIF